MNPTPTPNATVTIYGKEQPVYFGMMAMAEYEQLTGVTLNELATLNNGSGIHNTITLVYVGLKHGAKKSGVSFDLSPDDVSYLIDENGLQLVNEVTEIFIKQVTRISGVEETTTKKKPTKKAKKRSPANKS